MAQVTGFPGNGLRLTKSVVILAGEGDPNSSATVDVQQAGLGSLYLREDVASDQLYVCTTGGIKAAPGVNAVPAVWTGK